MMPRHNRPVRGVGLAFASLLAWVVLLAVTAVLVGCSPEQSRQTWDGWMSRLTWENTEPGVLRLRHGGKDTGFFIKPHEGRFLVKGPDSDGGCFTLDSCKADAEQAWRHRGEFGLSK